jgi:hypothetical protein
MIQDSIFVKKYIEWIMVKKILLIINSHCAPKQLVGTLEPVS